MKIINRIIVTPFILVLLIGIFERDWLVLAALIAIPLGILQVLFCLRILIGWKMINEKTKIFEISYFILVVGYFLFLNYSTATSWNGKSINQNIVYSLPILLALSVTYILEKNLSHENIE
ncbi:hypothetical protein BTO06_12860 [Tenacibaculum sp. SZ-18]|uniref:hypothetical protein n=1 Tax=Tenacibaculum sp. SZ-18 TaxID=754423 RepID=UPI000C2CE3BB|nr:hypothetical protein [Tenacibaculum sp. SZ-18]AUC15990.1 hypothetical protein BTO06_12860 [Tenacibaculum sp. SZ-18]